MRLNMAQRAGWLAHLYKAAFQQHHRELIPVLKPFIPEAGVVIDVGAHAGQFAKLFARLAPKGKVFAFEPSPYALSILRPALRLNGLSNVRIVPEGLSDAPGAYELSTPIKKRGGLGFGIAHLGTDAEERRPQMRHEVKVGTLDAFAQAEGLERLDFLKMDIEGWETPALRGGLGIIARFRPAMLVEINEGHLARSGSKPSDIWDMLTPLGYRARRLGAEGEAAAYVGSGDYVWTA
jgi:FkbM family methyltransferase